MITINDLAKIELKIGTILETEEVEGSEKLLKFKVDLGEEVPRQILSGIKFWYKNPAALIGKQVVVVVNLEPRTMMGLESQGMILMADGNKPILLKPASKVLPGTKIR